MATADGKSRKKKKMDVLARGIKDLSPWRMLYADDIVLCGTL